MHKFNFKQFIKVESLSGIILFVVSLAAFLFDNSPFSLSYQHFLNLFLDLHFSSYSFSASLLQSVNEGLMVLFFLLIGLEVKREIRIGELNSIKKISLPLVAAFGGMLIPAMIFIIFNYKDAIALQGFAIPVATDIAFALAVLSLLGKRIPSSLKTFLMALAIFDDIGAILIIAFFYSDHIALLYLAWSGLCLLFLLGLNFLGVNKTSIYLLLGILLWFLVLKSGVHATLSGVFLALTMPVNPSFERKLHPWVAYGVLPLFGFCNAGVSLQGVHASWWLNPILWGIILGLFIGKQLGVLLFARLAVKCRLAQLPAGISASQFYGVALLCGIGFTMSLFIGVLSYHDVNHNYETLMRLGVFTGSLLSGLCGYFVLRFKK